MSDSKSIRPSSGEELAALVDRTRAGDPGGWREIIKRFDGSLRAIGRAHGLDAAACSDVVQQTWLAAFSCIDGLRNKHALGSWLRSIARRECVKILTYRRREPIGLDDIDDCASDQLVQGPPVPEGEVLRAEQATLLRAAWRQLSEQDQRLLTVLIVESRPAYADISRDLGIPMGSIGPTRARCLARLRGHLVALGVDSIWVAA
jgi:RNA polymerase sigma factor (sigma-70 family)